MLVLAIGDIIGKPGRRAVCRILPGIRQQFGIDLVVANGFGSNLRHSRGTTQRRR